MSGFSRLKGRFLFIPLSAVLWPSLALPAVAAGPRAPEVVGALDCRLTTLSRLAPSVDVVSYLWAAYYPATIPHAGEVVAGQILLRAIQRPEALPRIAVALDAMAPGGRGVAISRRLENLVGRYRREPNTLGLVQQMTAPLDRDMARSAARRETVKGFDYLGDALFDGVRRRPAADESSRAAAGKSERTFSGPAARIGAGSRNFGQDPGSFRFVRPAELLSKRQRASLDAILKAAAAADGPRVLAERELEALHAGRAAYSSTLTYGGSTDEHNRHFRRAARMVNRWVAEGEDLRLDMLIELNRALCRGQFGKRGEFGRIRTENLIWGLGFSKAEWILAYLTDFWIWYRANEGRLHPIHLAAASYQQLVRIHPFKDANGRTTRLVMDLILQRKGYLPAVFTRAYEPDPERFIISAAAVDVSTVDVVRNVAHGVAAAEEILGRAR